MGKGVMYIALTVVALGALILVASPTSVAVAEDDGGCCTELVEALDNMCSELTQMNETLAGEKTKKHKVEWEGIAGPPGPIVDGGTYAEAIATEVAAATGNQFAIEFNPWAGSPGQDFDAIDAREKDIGILPPDVGQFQPAIHLFVQPEGLLSAAELSLWYLAEGQDLFQQMLSGTNVRAVDGARLLGPTQVFLHSRVPITSTSDFNPEEGAQLKIRVAGPAAEVFDAWGAELVPLRLGQIWLAMDNGDIDAFEAGSLSINWYLNFYEVAEFVYLSECRAPTAQTLGVNQDSWSELPDEFKVILEAVAADQSLELYERWCEEDMWAYEQFQQYTDCTVQRLSEDVETEFIAEINSIYDGWVAEGLPFVAEVLASQREFQETFRAVWPRP